MAPQQIRCKADRRIGGNAGKRIAAAALHPHHQLGCRAGFALAAVKMLKVTFRYRQDIVHHGLEADVLFILQTHNTRRLYRDRLHIFGTGQQTLRL